MNTYLDNFSFFPRVDHDKQKFLRVLDNLKKLNGYEVKANKHSFGRPIAERDSAKQNTTILRTNRPSRGGPRDISKEVISNSSPSKKCKSVSPSNKQKTVCFDESINSEKLANFKDKSPNTSHGAQSYREQLDLANKSQQNGSSSLNNLQATFHPEGGESELNEQKKCDQLNGYLKQATVFQREDYSTDITKSSIKKHRRLKAHSPAISLVKPHHEESGSILQIQREPSPVRKSQELIQEHNQIKSRIRSFTDFAGHNRPTISRNITAELLAERTNSANSSNRARCFTNYASDLRKAESRAMKEFALFSRDNQTDRPKSYDDTINKHEYVQDLVNKSFGEMKRSQFIEKMSSKESMHQYNKVQILQSRQIIKVVEKRLRSQQRTLIDDPESTPPIKLSGSYLEKFIEEVKVKPNASFKKHEQKPERSSLFIRKPTSNYGLTAGMSPGKLQEYSQKVNKLELQHTFGLLETSGKRDKRSSSEKSGPNHRLNTLLKQNNMVANQTPKFFESESMFPYPKPPQTKKSRAEVEEAVNKQVRKRYNKLVDKSPLRQIRGSRYKQPSLYIQKPTGMT